MENQSIAYSAKELLARLQGPILMQVIANPAELRMLVENLDGISGIADYLAETEQRMYPDLAPKHRALRRNRVRVVVKQQDSAPTLPEETHETRIVAFVGRWIKKRKHPPTFRDIRNGHRSYEDLQSVVEKLVGEGRLSKIIGERTAYYTLPEKEISE